MRTLRSTQKVSYFLAGIAVALILSGTVIYSISRKPSHNHLKEVCDAVYTDAFNFCLGRGWVNAGIHAEDCALISSYARNTCVTKGNE